MWQQESNQQLANGGLIQQQIKGRLQQSQEQNSYQQELHLVHTEEVMHEYGKKQAVVSCCHRIANNAQIMKLNKRYMH